VTAPTPTPTGDAPLERRLRHSWWFFAGSFAALALILASPLLADTRRLLDAVVVVLVAVVGAAALLHRNAVQQIETGRRAEAESFARILQGLSRSVSPDAILDAIVEELGVGTRADHVVLVRRRADSDVVDATLVSSRAGVPSTVTRFPLIDLEDPLERAPDDREPVAVPIAAGAELELAGLSMRRGVVLAGDLSPAPWAPGRAGTASLPSTRGLPVRVGTRGAIADAARAGMAVARRHLAAVPPGLTGRGAGDPSPASARQASPAVDGGAPGRIAERIADRARASYGLGNTLAAPLVTETGVVGAIVLSRRGSDQWPSSARRILAGAAVEASAALARATHHREAETRATTDALTGLPNRRYFDEFCGLLARRRRADDAVGVLLVDIDRFKLVNDTWGHAAGDQVLRAVARAILAAVRDDDVPARFGGEEFAVLLRNPSRAVAEHVGERVRAAVRHLDLGDLGPDQVTVSVGVAVAEAEDQPIAEIIAAADGALYEAKRTGRDRVVAA
jgi:diguanylate cyclase (GGDEF)-like protein